MTGGDDLPADGGGQALAARARPLAIVAGPLACALVLVTAPGDLAGAPLHTLAVAVWVALWWVLEALPIAATSLLPLVLLPAFGIKSAGDVARLYMEDLLILLLGGFLLALALERWGLHRRLALATLALLGGAPRRLVVGFALAAALLSMWISNSGTTLVLLPIALAVGQRLGRELPPAAATRFERAVLLAIAFGATAGGLGTYVGTPPNLVFRERYARDFGAGSVGGPPEITFLDWMVAFAPLALLLSVLIGGVLAIGLPRVDGAATRAVVRAERTLLPPWCAGERLVALLFAAAAVLWITREPFTVGARDWFGWAQASWPGGIEWKKGTISDGTVAMALVLLCFVVRVRPAVGMREHAAGARVPLLEWNEAERRMPWGILLLFGGGFALGDAFKTSGLSEHLGHALAGALSGTPEFVVVLGTCLFVVFVSEFMNNTACAQVLLPILGAVAPRLGLPPALLLVAATLAASCGFMMPAGTAPNAIVFATRRLRIGDMARVGLLLDLLCALLVTGWLLFVAPRLGLPLGR
ncbi:MAG: SLC13/DASS family transporter [Planctomycetes bacterium]|nr:SLC13/DASS family transporter [Planctomycetota bacterium]